MDMFQNIETLSYTSITFDVQKKYKQKILKALNKTPASNGNCTTTDRLFVFFILFIY